MVGRGELGGAHYGLRDWLLQRLTALFMLFYIFMLVFFLLMAPSSYEAWRFFFSQLWVRIFTQMTLLALVIHAWVGVRDIWMDYIKSIAWRLTLHSLTFVWLLSCLIYSVYVIWGVA